MAEAIVNIGANTGQATAAVEDLNSALGQTGEAASNATEKTENLTESLAKQEARIKVIDGAINVLGGTVELAASAFIGLGLASEEQAKEFEAAALGAIAFADGAKRTFDGVKNLTEGLKAYGGIAGAARKAQAALNATVLANPWVLLAAAVAAVSVALVAYYNSQVEAEEAVKSGTAAIEAQIEAKKKLKEETDRLREADSEYSKSLGGESKELQRQLNLLQAKGASEAEIFAKKKELIQSEINDLNRRLGNIAGNTELEAELNNQILDAVNKLDVAQAEYDRKRLEASQKAIDFLKQEKALILDIRSFREKEAKQQKEAVESFIEGLGGRVKQTEGVIQRTLPQATQAVVLSAETATLTFADQLQKINMDLNEFFDSSTGQAVQASLTTAASLAATLSRVQDDTTEEGFEKAKKYKVAEVVTSAIQSSFQAFGAAQQFGPILGPILGAAQVAAIAIASNKAIQDIQNSSFSAPGAISTSVGAGATPPLAGATSFGGGFVTGGPPVVTPTDPIRAYVVTGDVVNGIQASGQIQRRRTLGPG
jgi:hypothetical protein